MRKISIGADIGGSHISTMAIDKESGSILRETHAWCEVDCQGSADDILHQWTQCVRMTMQQSENHDLCGIGFAMPGPFNYPEGIALFSGVNKFDTLYGVNIRKRLASMLDLPASIPIRFLNDATCFAIGETWLGEASRHTRVIAITLGTGFGSAFMQQGTPVSTGESVPAHGWVYHLPFGNSIADDNFSTRWFIKRYKEITGNQASGAKVIAEATAEDPAARQVFDEFGRNLGGFMLPLIKRFGATCLVIGGSIAQSYNLFSTPFLSGLAAGDAGSLLVYPSAMGEDAAIAGSARLCNDRFYNTILASGS
jgi:glucokinase